MSYKYEENRDDSECLNSISDIDSIRIANKTRLNAILNGDNTIEALRKILLLWAKSKLQKRILELMCDGYSQSDVARILNVSRQEINYQLKKYKQSIDKNEIKFLMKLISDCDNINDGSFKPLFINLL